jgi:hypothetical protein
MGGLFAKPVLTAAITLHATLADSNVDPCTFVPGAAVGTSEILLAGDFYGVELQCALAVRAGHQSANGARLHRSMCSAVFDMHNVAPDPLGEQRSCYLYPSSAVKDTCAAAPSACTGTFGDASLSLADAALLGTVPSTLGMLHATLEHLELARNAISGSLPSQLGRLTRLQTLSLESLRLSGTVPSQLGQLTALQFLALHGNALAGSMPSQLGMINPPFCYWANAQRDPSAPRDGDSDDNHFDCPLPALSAGCGMNSVAFGRRDAHHVAAGACAMPGVAYHALRAASDAEDT